VTATLSRDHESEHAEFTIERLTEPSAIRGALSGDRAYAAYALAQLEPRLFAMTEWYTAQSPSGSALILHSRGGLGRALFASGDPVALDAALSLHPGARFSFGSLHLEHRPIVEKYFMMTRPQTMLRMSVTPDTLRRPDGDESVRLTGRDVSAVNRLYSVEGGPTTYRSIHIDDGVYYGLIEDEKLISVAGTHVVSQREGVAVVGNVFTHPRFRGQGHARKVTAAVSEELLRTCPLVVLTVEESNEPAVAAYKRIGYEAVCTLHETPLIRKEPVGAISLLRRLAAGWKGRHEGKEIVSP
jgi:ribosomal protein S18 acetylase RimI-like enzyme